MMFPCTTQVLELHKSADSGILQQLVYSRKETNVGIHWGDCSMTEGDEEAPTMDA